MNQPTVILYSHSPSRIARVFATLGSCGFRVVPVTTMAALKATCKSCRATMLLISRTKRSDQAQQAASEGRRFGLPVVALHDVPFLRARKNKSGEAAAGEAHLAWLVSALLQT